jgi:hypothetical protein
VRRGTWKLAGSLLGTVALLAGCHSYHIEATVVNRTGAEVRLLEVDYPSASFGTDRLAADATFHYRFQTRGEGPLTVQYTGSNERQVQITGPTLHERQEGQLEIDLLPGGKVAIHPALTPQR